ncbi:uncharacterized protein AB9W97_003132 [Spinachia spinachia]
MRTEMLPTCDSFSSGPVHTVQALLEEATGVEKVLLQMISVKNSITASSSSEDQASLSEQVSQLQDHKRALDSSIRGGHSLLTDTREKAQVTCLQTNLKELCGNSEVSRDLTQLKQQQYTIQVSPVNLHPHEVELDKDFFEEVFRSESDTPHLASRDTTVTPCPPAPPSAANKKKSSELRDQKDNPFTEKETMETTKEQKLTTALPKINVKNFSVSQQETFETVPDAQEKDKHCRDICGRPYKVFTIVLDLQHQDNVGACSPDVLRSSQEAKICYAQLTKSSSVADKKSDGFTTLPDPKSHETDLEIHYTKRGALSESPEANSLPRNPLVFVASEFEDINSTDALLLGRGKSESQALMHGEVLNSSKSIGTVAECQLTGAHAAETTSSDVRREEMTHFCHAEDQTMSSVLCAGEVEDGTATQIPAADNKQLTVAAGTGQLVRADGGSPESLQSKLSKVPKRRVKATLPLGGSEKEVTALPEDRQVNKITWMSN